MAGLQIYAPRERRMVAAADAVLSPLGWFGDLLMTLDAIAAARTAWPGATIDLAVGSWNRDLAKLIPGLGTVITLDVPWRAHQGAGDRWSPPVSPTRAR